MLLERNRVVILAIIVAFISLIVYWVGKVEYFKAFPFVFVIAFTVFTLRGPSPLPQKLKSVGIYVILGAIMLLAALLLWR
ncbi:MAG TPA: hypothetical protein VHX60_01605 [Acidobacteriaceae bacterium]|nr:hypothetical protein [Acidobacteriaceae bacterium]